MVGIGIGGGRLGSGTVVGGGGGETGTIFTPSGWASSASAVQALLESVSTLESVLSLGSAVSLILISLTWALILASAHAELKALNPHHTIAIRQAPQGGRSLSRLRPVSAVSDRDGFALPHNDKGPNRGPPSSYIGRLL